MNPRSCGSCTACCRTFSIPELKKPIGEPCRHLCAHGCAIYSRRPTSCFEFRCTWIDGQGPDSARPDLLGLIFDSGAKGTYLRITVIRPDARPLVAPVVRASLGRYRVIRVIIGPNIEDHWSDGVRYAFAEDRQAELSPEARRRVVLVAESLRGARKVRP